MRVLTQKTDLSMERFFGGSPILIVLKLVIASLIIGVVLSFFGFNPNNLYHAIIRLGDWISSLGFDAVKTTARYIILGALIVIPLWLLARFFSFLGSGRRVDRSEIPGIAPIQEVKGKILKVRALCEHSPQRKRLRSRDVLVIAIPMILSNATVPLVGIADTAIMGQFNDPALIGGVALGSTIFAMLFWAFGFLRMGTTGLTAQAVPGSGMTQKSRPTCTARCFIAVAAGMLLFAFHAPAILLILKLTGGSAEVQTTTGDYFGVRILSAPATLANYALVGWLIGMARAKLALVLQLFLNVINIALAILLVLVAGKGVKGKVRWRRCSRNTPLCWSGFRLPGTFLANARASGRLFLEREFFESPSPSMATS